MRLLGSFFGGASIGGLIAMFITIHPEMVIFWMVYSIVCAIISAGMLIGSRNK